MRILLTGGSGQIGGALQQPLSALGSVFAPDRTSLDLTKPKLLERVLDDLSPDLIVNPAAYTAVDQAEDEPELAYLINAEAAGTIARWAASRSIPMLHFSTDYVYNGSGGEPWREDDLTGPLSVYGASKLAGEIAIQEACGYHLIIRTSWVYATRGKNFLSTIARLARERDTLRIVADQFGAPTSARSIAQGVMSILSCVDTSSLDLESVRHNFMKSGGLVNLASSGEASWHEFASAIVHGLRSHSFQLAVHDIVAIATRDFPVKATRPLNSRLDCSRLAKIFGVQMPDWRDTLEVELDHFSRLQKPV